MKHRAVPRYYFFEIFTLINLTIIVYLLRRMTDAPLRTLPLVLTKMTAAFALQTAAGVAVRAMVAEHKSGRTNLGHALWTLLTLEVFLRHEDW